MKFEIRNWKFKKTDGVNSRRKVTLAGVAGQGTGDSNHCIDIIFLDIFKIDIKIVHETVRKKKHQRYTYEIDVIYISMTITVKRTLK